MTDLKSTLILDENSKSHKDLPLNASLLPSFSIVTPSFNQGNFIRQTIESVLSQNYPNLEYWVIDGGSTDNTLQVLREYESDPCFNWISEPDKGQSDAINKGLAKCKGDIFNWINSDDVLLPHALKRIASVWIKMSRPCIIFGRAKFIDQDGKDLGYCSVQNPNVTLQDLVSGDYSLIQPATFVPTNQVRNIGGVDSSFHYRMDFDMHVKLAEKLPIYYVPCDIAFYRLHSASKTVALNLGFIDDTQRILDRASKKGLLSPKKIKPYTNILATKLYLRPANKNVVLACKSALTAVFYDYSVAPKTAVVLLKGFIRLSLKEKNWWKVRRFIFDRSKLLQRILPSGGLQ